MPETHQTTSQDPLSKNRPAYVAGMGMITSIGFNAAMTAASVKAGISGYQSSDFFNEGAEQITMATVPESVFSLFTVEEEDDDLYSIQYDRIIKMAILAIHEALSNIQIKQTIPLILAVPEDRERDNYVPLDLLISKLLQQEELPFKVEHIRFVSTGRAGRIQALEIAKQYLYEQGSNYVLVGASDSYVEASRLSAIDNTKRLLAPNRMDGFVAGEGAGFMLLTQRPDAAMIKNNHVVAISSPGFAQESGHLYSDETYKGDGLDQAFKKALRDYTGANIGVVYSSMNGENYWAKEYGVAMIRNKKHFKESVSIEHPADCYGDLGAATGPVLLGLSACELFKQTENKANLVYSSSDSGWRAAVRMEKIALV